MKAIRRHLATFLAAIMVFSTISNTYISARASGEVPDDSASSTDVAPLTDASWTETSGETQTTAIESEPVDQSWDSTGASENIPDAQIVEVTEQPFSGEEITEEPLTGEGEEPIDNSTEVVNIRGPTLVVNYDASVGGSVSTSSETAETDGAIILHGSTAVADNGYIFEKWVADDGQTLTEEAHYQPDLNEINYVLANYLPDANNEIHVTYTAQFKPYSTEYEYEIPNVIKVYVQVSEGAFDTDVELVVDQIAADTQTFADAEAAMEDAERGYNGMMAFDIRFEDVETGMEVEPLGEVRVNFEILKDALVEADGFAVDGANDSTADYEVLHLKQDAYGEMYVDEVVADTAGEVQYGVDVATDYNDNATNVEADFMVGSFSVFVVTIKQQKKEADAKVFVYKPVLEGTPGAVEIRGKYYAPLVEGGVDATFTEVGDIRWVLGQSQAYPAEWSFAGSQEVQDYLTRHGYMESDITVVKSVTGEPTPYCDVYNFYSAVDSRVTDSTYWIFGGIQKEAGERAENFINTLQGNIRIATAGYYFLLPGEPEVTFKGRYFETDPNGPENVRNKLDNIQYKYVKDVDITFYYDANGELTYEARDESGALLSTIPYFKDTAWTGPKGSQVMSWFINKDGEIAAVCADNKDYDLTTLEGPRTPATRKDEFYFANPDDVAGTGLTLKANVYRPNTGGTVEISGTKYAGPETKDVVFTFDENDYYDLSGGVRYYKATPTLADGTEIQTVLRRNGDDTYSYVPVRDFRVNNDDPENPRVLVIGDGFDWGGWGMGYNDTNYADFYWLTEYKTSASVVMHYVDDDMNEFASEELLMDRPGAAEATSFHFADIAEEKNDAEGYYTYVGTWYVMDSPYKKVNDLNYVLSQNYGGQVTDLELKADGTWQLYRKFPSTNRVNKLTINPTSGQLHVYHIYRQNPRGGSKGTGGTSAGGEIVIPEPHHEKTVVQLAEEPTYDLTLTIRGEEGSETNKTQIDVLFIVDKSPSISWAIGNISNQINRLQNLITANPNVDAQFAITYFGSFSSGDGKRNDAYRNEYYNSYQGQTQGWSERVTVNQSTNAREFTNYQAGFRDGKRLLNEARPDSRKVVIFITDGKPVRSYIMRNQYNASTTKMEDGIAEASGITANEAYAIGFAMGASFDYIDEPAGDRSQSGTGTKKWMNTQVLLQRHLDVMDVDKRQVFLAENISALEKALGQIAAQVTAIDLHDVHIEDQLNPYVYESLDDRNNLRKLGIQVCSADGNTVVAEHIETNVAFNGNVATVTWTFNDNGTNVVLTASYNKSSRKLKLDFPELYKLNTQYTYKVVMMIEPSTKAYEEFAGNNADPMRLAYLSEDGEAHKGEATTGTHANDYGFWSNVDGSAIVTYKYGDISNSLPYLRPVVQVREKSAQVIKIWDEGEDAESAAEFAKMRPESVTFTLQVKNGENGAWVDYLENNKPVTLTLTAADKTDDNTWVGQIDHLPARYERQWRYYRFVEKDADVPSGYTCVYDEATGWLAADAEGNEEKIDTTTITNVFNKTSVKVVKEWPDGVPQDAEAHIIVQLHLIKNGNREEAYREVTLTIDHVSAENPNVWEYTFENLPASENGVAIKYEVEEVYTPGGYVLDESASQLSAREGTDGLVTKLVNREIPGAQPTRGGKIGEVEPVHEKYVEYLNNGTYDLTLTVGGKEGMLVTPVKMDILFVVDYSGSMLYGMNNGYASAPSQGSTTTETTYVYKNTAGQLRTFTWTELYNAGGGTQDGYHRQTFTSGGVRYTFVCFSAVEDTYANYNNTRLKQVADVTTGLANEIAANPNIDAQFNVVSFEGRQTNYFPSTHPQYTAWSDAQSRTGWTTDPQAVANEFTRVRNEKYIKRWFSTNYEAGIREAMKQLEGARDGAQTIVIFISDGEPTLWYDENGGRKGDGYYTINGAQQAALQNIAGLRANALYTVSVGADHADTTARLAELRNAATQVVKRDQGYSAANSAELQAAFKQITSDIQTVDLTNVKITDTLDTQKVEFVGSDGTAGSGNAKLKIAIYNNTQYPNGTPMFVTPEAERANNVSLTFTDKDKDGNDITVTAHAVRSGSSFTLSFTPADYKANPDWIYTVTAHIEPTQWSYDQYGKDPDVGDPNTDAPGNNTSSGKPGFHSNNPSFTKLEYEYGGDPYKKDYPEPVVQVEVKGYDAFKKWEDNNNAFGTRPHQITLGVFSTDPTVRNPVAYLPVQGDMHADTWTVSFGNLRRWHNEKEIFYEVKELRQGGDPTNPDHYIGLGESSNYSTTYSGDTVINTLDQAKIEINKTITGFVVAPDAPARERELELAAAAKKYVQDNIRFELYRRLPGGTYELYKTYEGSAISFNRDGTMKTIVENVPVGEYYVRELNILTGDEYGYNVTASVDGVTKSVGGSSAVDSDSKIVKGGESVQFNFVNHYERSDDLLVEPAQLQIVKVDEFGNPISAPATFRLDRGNGQIETLRTEGGVATISNLTGTEAGDTYYLTLEEIDAPAGYQRTDAKWTISISRNNPRIEKKETKWTLIYGTAVKVTVTETEQLVYDPENNLISFRIKNEELREIKVTKNWQDTNNQDRIRNAETAVRVELVGTAEGKEVFTQKKEIKTGTNNTGTVTFERLKVHYTNPETGVVTKIDYEVYELDAEGNRLTTGGKLHLKNEVNGREGDYDVTISGSADDGFVIDNAYEFKKVNARVEKNWDDNHNQDGARPTEIQVQLMIRGENGTLAPATRNGIVLPKVTLTSVDRAAAAGEIVVKVGGDTWGYEWTDLPKYNNAGVEIKYVVVEYINKTQVDDGDTIELTKDGETFVYDAKYDYPTEGYDGWQTTITNHHEPKTTKIYVKKYWDDQEDQDGIREQILNAGGITINLLADGVQIRSQTIKPAGKFDEWVCVFDNLDMYKDGTKITYTITEDSLDSYGYKTVYKTPDGRTGTGSTKEDPLPVTNSYKPGTKNVHVQKVWQDGANRDGLRMPVEVRLEMKKVTEPESAWRTATKVNGTVQAVVTLEAPDYTYDWVELDEKLGGVMLEYRVVEVTDLTGRGYLDPQYSSDGAGLIITNPYTPKTTEVSVLKVWDDESNVAGVRPDEIRVALYAFDGLAEADMVYAGENAADFEAVHVIGRNDSLSYTWNNLYVYYTDAAGTREIVYSVVELDAQGNPIRTLGKLDVRAKDVAGYPANSEDEVIAAYDVKVEKTATNNYTITNSYHPEKVKVTAEKEWSDLSQRDNLREKVQVELVHKVDGAWASMSPRMIKEFTVADVNSVEFTGLDKFVAGKVNVLEEYRIFELDAAGNWVKDGETLLGGSYTADYDGADDESKYDWSVVNENKPVLTRVTVTKVWDDENDNDGKRPETVTFRLMAGNNIANRADVYAGTLDTWSATVTIPTSGGTQNGNTWTYTWDDLYYKNNGAVIDYHVVEVNGASVFTKETNGTATFTTASGAVYKVTVGDVAVSNTDQTTSGKEYTQTITNASTPEKVAIPVKKTWDDAHDQDGRRETLTFTLYKEVNGVKTELNTMTLAPNAAAAQGNYDVWEGVFTTDSAGNPLYRYEGKQEIRYIVEESGLADGYTATTVDPSMKTDANYYEKEVTLTVDGKEVKATYAGWHFINKYAPGKVSVKVTKSFADDNNREGVRPTYVTVQLFANGVAQGEAVTLNEANGWTKEWTDLDEKKGGQTIVYTVEELASDGKTRIEYTPAVTYARDTDATGTWNGTYNADYDVEITGTGLNGQNKAYEIVNTHEPEKTGVTVTKDWRDDNNNDGKRPDSVTVRLLANGSEAQFGEAFGKSAASYQTTRDGEAYVATVTLSEANNWTYTWDELFVRIDGREVTYTVVEMEGDTELKEGDRLTEKKTADGVTPQKRYVVSYEQDGNNWTVINTREKEKTEIKVIKHWNDLNNRQGYRRDVTVELYADGQPTGKTLTITKTAYDTENDKFVTFTDLDRYNDGTEIRYEVYELDADGTLVAKLGELHNENGDVIYTVDYSGVRDIRDNANDTVKYEQTVTNENAPGTTRVTVEKVWADNDNQDGKRPLKVEFKLIATTPEGRQLAPADYVTAEALASFSEVVTLTADAAGNYAVLSGSWENLYEMYNGQPISYTVIELGTNAEGKLADKEGAFTYTVEIDAVTPAGAEAAPEPRDFVVTNSREPEKVDVEIIKKWDDDFNRDGLREAIEVELVADGVPTGQTGTLTTKQNASVKFTGLDKYKNGQLINYTVRERDGGVIVEQGGALLNGAYTVSYADSGLQNGVYKTTATNKHIPETTFVEVQKVWEDDDNRDGVRPASVFVQLQYADGTAVPGAEVRELNAANGYYAKWDGLTAYRNTAADADAEGAAEITPVRYRVVELYTKGGDALDAGDKLQDKNRKDSYTVSYKYENGSAEFITAGDALAGYEAGVTNSYEPETVEVKVTKSWIDANNQDGKRPPTLTYTLYADGTPVAEAVVKIDTAHNDSSKNSGAYTFAKVLKAGTDAAGNTITLFVTDEGSTDTLTLFRNKPEGVKINYNVTETAVDEYGTVKTGEAGDYEFHFDNSYTPGETSVTVTKNWNDDTNRDGYRQKDDVSFFVRVELRADGVKATVPAGQQNPATIRGDGASVTWSGLPQKANGKDIVYTVVEYDSEGNAIELDANGEGVFSTHYTVTMTGDATNGIIFVNTEEPEKTEVRAKKVWDDAHNQDGYRPATIRFQLLADGQPVIETVDENGQIVKLDSYILTLDAFDANGVYDESAFVTFENLVKNAAKTSATDPTREVVYTVVELDENGQQVKDGETLVVTTADERTGLYGVTITGDQSEGYVITNKLTPEELTLKVTKHWDDDNNREGLRESVFVGLYIGDNKIDEKELGTAEGAEATFGPLDKYAAGAEIAYDIYELDGKGGERVGDAITMNGATYTVTREGGRRDIAAGRYAYDTTRITNAHEPELVDVTITKVWDDADNQDGFRPESVTFMLKADGVQATDAVAIGARTAAEMGYAFSAIITITPVTDPATGEVTWPTYTWKDLYKMYEGEDITYTVVELDNQINNKELAKGDDLTDKNGNKTYDVADVVRTETTDAETGKTTVATEITNHHKPEEKELKVVKTWNDSNDNDNVRPDSVWVALYADGQPTGRELELKKGSSANANQYEGTFTGLPVYANGTEIKYTIEELTGEGGAVVELDAALNGDGYTLTFKDATNVTNSRDIDLTEVTVTKVWDDADNQDGKRPTSIDVQLQVGGRAVTQQGINATVTLNEANGWTYTWTGLYEKEDGLRIPYEVVELNENGRAVTLDPKTDAEGKVYYIYNNDYTATVDSETAVQDAETGEITGTNATTWTNHHTPETIIIPVKKVWKDGNNQDGLREDLSFALKVGEETINTVTLHLTGETDWVQGADANEWLYIFRTDAAGNDLPKYEGGVAIPYTVEETTVIDGYTTTTDDTYTRDVDGVTYKGFAFTNSHDEEVLVVRVTKIWEDGANRDGKRPGEVTFYLKAGGVIIAREDVSWKNASMNENGDFEVTFDTVNVRNEAGFTIGDPLYVYRLNAAGVSEKVVYTIEEKAMDNYTASVTEEAADTVTMNGVEITRLNWNVLNPYTPGSTEVSVTKIWDDLNDRDGLRGNGTVQVQLLANGEEAIEVLEPVDPANPDATRRVLDTYKDGWVVELTDGESYKFENLVINGKDGKPVVYTVVELDRNGNKISLTEETTPDGTVWTGAYDENYDVTITGDQAEGYTVTNKHVPPVTKVTVEKIWHDANDKDGVRPNQVSFLLLADGEVATKEVVGGTDNFNAVATITVDASGKWASDLSHTWDELFVNNNGEEIKYTVVELKNNESTGAENRLAQGDILPNKNGETTHTETDKDGNEYTVIDGYDVAYSEITGNAKDGYSITVTNTHDSKIEKEVSAPATVGTTNAEKDHLDLLEKMRNEEFTYTIRTTISDRDKLTEFTVTDKVVEELEIVDGSVKIVTGPEGGKIATTGQTITVTWGDGKTLLADSVKGQDVVITFNAKIKPGVNLSKYISVTENRVEVPNDSYYDYKVEGELNFPHDPHPSNKVTTTPPEEEPKKTVDNVEHVDLTDRQQVVNYKVTVTIPEKNMETFVIEDDLADVLIYVADKNESTAFNATQHVAVTIDGKAIDATVTITGRDTLKVEIAKKYFTEGADDMRGKEVEVSFYARIRTTEENGGVPVDLGQYMRESDDKGNPLTPDNEFVRIPNKAYYIAGIGNEPKYTNTVTITPPPPEIEKEVTADEGGETLHDNTHADLAARYGVFTYTLRTNIPEVKGLTEFVISDTLEPVLQFVSKADGATSAGNIRLTVMVNGEEIAANATIKSATKDVNGETKKTQMLEVKLPQAYLADQYKGQEVVVIFNARIREGNDLDGKPVDLTPYMTKVIDTDDADAVNIPNDARYDVPPEIDIPDEFKTSNKVTVTPPPPEIDKEVEALEGGTTNADKTHADLVDRSERFKFTVTTYVPERKDLEEFIIEDYVAKGLEVIDGTITVTVNGQAAETKAASAVKASGTRPAMEPTNMAYDYEQVVRVSLGDKHLTADQGKKVVVTFEARIKDGADLSAYMGDIVSVPAQIPNDSGYSYRTPKFPNQTGESNRVTVTPPDPKIYKEVMHADGTAERIEVADDEELKVLKGMKTHIDLTAYDEVYTYKIDTHLPDKNLEEFTIRDQLEPALEFVDVDKIVVTVGGVKVTGAVKIQGQTLTVTIPAQYLGKSKGEAVHVEFYAKVKEGANLSTYPKSEAGDPLVPNTTGYRYNFSNDWEESNKVTVTPKPELAEVKVTKAWDDDNDRDGVRPDSITVTLTASEPDALSGFTKDFLTVTLKPTGNTWPEHTWTGLPKYVDGRLVTYSVTEDAIAEYRADYKTLDAVVNKAPADGQTTTTYQVDITNVHTPGKTQVSVVKIWNDAGDRDRIRPATITVRLLANGTEVARATLSAQTTWSHTFDDLFIKADGKEITYTVTEDTVARYTTQITGTRYAYTITNTYVPNDPPPETPPTPPEPPAPPTPPPVEQGQVLGARRTDAEAVLGARRGKTGEKSQENRLMTMIASGAMAMLMAVAGRRKRKVDGD